MPLVNADQLEVSAPRWTVEDIMPEVGIGVAHGPSATGKSLALGTDLALAVANGVPWFGHETIQGPVVYCLGEGLYDAGVRTQGRLAREKADRELAALDPDVLGNQTAEEYLASLPPYTDEFLYFITEPFAVPLGSGGTPSPGLQRAIDQMSRLPGLALVIIDATSDFAGDRSITNDASASRYVAGLNLIKSELDCTVMIIGHDTQRGGMLGAGRFFNAADFVIAVKPEITIPGLESSTIISKKAKYGSRFTTMSYRVDPIAWDEPVRDDETGELTGETARITTRTVRLNADNQDDGGLRLPGTPRETTATLPDLQEAPVAPARRKRNGLRSGSVPSRREAQDTAQRAEMIAALLAGTCPECGATPGSGCRAIEGKELILLDQNPPLTVHTTRANAAVEAAPARRETLLAQFTGPKPSLTTP